MKNITLTLMMNGWKPKAYESSYRFFPPFGESSGGWMMPKKVKEDKII